MAGASSETGYPNIGAAETSSHTEVKPEIQADGATGDSDEVSKTGETKKPKSPALKCTDKGLRKAADDSDWYSALRRRDCKKLMALLQANPCLVAQMGPEGWTVLHAAVKRGCMQLLDQVFDIFRDEQLVDFRDRGQFVDEASGVNLYLNDLLEAKCGEYEALALDMAEFTCSTEFQMVLSRGSRYGDERFSAVQRFSSDAIQQLMDECKNILVEIMQREPSIQAFKNLKKGYEANFDYNFVLERKELQFHYACRDLTSPDKMEYVKTIIGVCLELEPLIKSEAVLTYLFQICNAQGRTPFHVAVEGSGGVSGSGCKELLAAIPRGDVYNILMNLRDVRKWTALQCAVATNKFDSLEQLLNDDRVDVNARGPGRDVSDFAGLSWTALHLAILHNCVKGVKLLLECSRTDVNALFCREIVCGHERMRPGDVQYDSATPGSSLLWTPLQLAAIMGHTDVVRVLLESKRNDIYDYGKLRNNYIPIGDREAFKISALLYASISGKPDMLRLFLDNSIFNPLVKFQKATALHYAAMVTTVRAREVSMLVGEFLYFTDLGYLDCTHHHYLEELKDILLTPRSYLGREACITMLLQAGIDIWEKDNQGRFAEPGPQACEETLLWWHDRVARETFEAKKSLNDAANAISVVAALVATASFVGPLQPPLGYGGDSMEGGVQDTHLSVRVFMVSNILSFYLAIASIMFAILPSLPMPQEGIYEEWQRTRRSVGVAIFFLLTSVLGVLISFGTASNLVVSKDYSWQHAGLSFYPTLVGGFICILGISLFFIRLLRLVFHRNATIRYLYKTFVKL